MGITSDHQALGTYQVCPLGKVDYWSLGSHVQCLRSTAVSQCSCLDPKKAHLGCLTSRLLLVMLLKDHLIAMARRASAIPPSEVNDRVDVASMNGI